MKNIRLLSVVVVAGFAAVFAFAADQEVPLVGAGQFAQCTLGKTDACQNSVIVKQDGKEVLYLVTENAVSKAFHDNICTDVKQIKVTGVVTEKAGQKEITASKIELVKG